MTAGDRFIDLKMSRAVLHNGIKKLGLIVQDSQNLVFAFTGLIPPEFSAFKNIRALGDEYFVFSTVDGDVGIVGRNLKIACISKVHEQGEIIALATEDEEFNIAVSTSSRCKTTL